MGVPLSQMLTVASYVLRQRLRGVKRYPLVLMLEPLFRCNLACAGCGKIQFPAEILRRHLTPEQCFAAVDECGAPMVSIPGGEPLIHKEIGEIVAARVLQGIGGAMMVPVGRLTVMKIVPREQYMAAMTFVTLPGQVGPLLGPALGGMLVEYAS